MIKLIYEEIDDQITKMIMKRLENSNKRHPEAEKELIDWFASKGIELEIVGWDKFNTGYNND